MPAVMGMTRHAEVIAPASFPARIGRHDQTTSHFGVLASSGGRLSPFGGTAALGMPRFVESPIPDSGSPIISSDRRSRLPIVHRRLHSESASAITISGPVVPVAGPVGSCRPVADAFLRAGHILRRRGRRESTHRSQRKRKRAFHKSPPSDAKRQSSIHAAEGDSCGVCDEQQK